jgi:ADP-ribosylglycohydrolase
VLEKKIRYLKLADALRTELAQSKDEGKNVSHLEEKIKEIEQMKLEDTKREKYAIELFDLMSNIPVNAEYNYIEPSSLEDIKEARSQFGKSLSDSVKEIDKEILYDKIYGAWLGRCCGCLLGKPIESWSRERIVGLLKETDNYPIKYYISSEISENLIKKYEVPLDAAWINKVEFAPEDDDTNYTLIGLKLIETFGTDFTPEDVADIWLNNLPVLHLCTAERVAYRNFLNFIMPPLSASYRNPYREWIGAQIRADFFGFINPGNPELAAEMAWRDASISHVKNGIYGEMFVAAMLSTAFIKSNIEEIIQIGLSQIPEKSRLFEEVNTLLSWKSDSIACEEAVERVHKKYNEKDDHDWCHTISNALIVCIGLLYGELDFEKSLGIAVAAGFDTDCNGATIGSIVGAIQGAQALPEKWIKPLNNKLKSGVDGFGLVEISDIARRTLDIAKKTLSNSQIHV